jgi:hypothetical protein
LHITLLLSATATATATGQLLDDTAIELQNVIVVRVNSTYFFHNRESCLRLPGDFIAPTTIAIVTIIVITIAQQPTQALNIRAQVRYTLLSWSSVTASLHEQLS